MKLRPFVIVAVCATLLAGLTACQTGVEAWTTCRPAADGNPTGTDGTYVLVCKDGAWEPVMTVKEFVAAARGESVEFGPLPSRPAPTATTTTTTTTTTVPASTVDQQALPKPPGNSAFVTCNGPNSAGQRFSPGRDGTLDKVGLALPTSGPGNNGPIDVLISIRTVDAGTGLPTSTEIGGGTFRGQSNAFDFVDMPLDLPATVAAGTTYAIVIDTAPGCTDGWNVQAAVDGNTGGLFDVSGTGLQSIGGGWAFRTWMR